MCVEDSQVSVRVGWRDTRDMAPLRPGTRRIDMDMTRTSAKASSRTGLSANANASANGIENATASACVDALESKASSMCQSYGRTLRMVRTLVRDVAEVANRSSRHDPKFVDATNRTRTVDLELCE